MAGDFDPYPPWLHGRPDLCETDGAIFKIRRPRSLQHIHAYTREEQATPLFDKDPSQFSPPHNNVVGPCNADIPRPMLGGLRNRNSRSDCIDALHGNGDRNTFSVRVVPGSAPAPPSGRLPHGNNDITV